MLEKCASLLQRNVWILFFPEGTRKIDGSTGPMGAFKVGAFKLALEQGVPIIPITISGARGLMPARGYPSLGFGDPKLIVHPPVSTTGKSVEQLMAECYAIMASALGPDDMIPPPPGAVSKAGPEEGSSSAGSSGAAAAPVSDSDSRQGEGEGGVDADGAATEKRGDGLAKRRTGK